MSKRNWFIAAGVCVFFAVVSVVLLAHNIVTVTPKLATFSSNGADQSTYWDKITVVLTLLSSGGFTVGGILTTILGFIQKGAAAGVDKVLPNASVDTKAKTVDVATIGAIQAALLLAKDQPTRSGLIVSGRAAFDDLRDRTFALPVPEVTA